MTTLLSNGLDHCYVFGSLLQHLGLKKFFEKRYPVTYFDFALDPLLVGSGRKIATLVTDHEYFITTKFH